jgi:predicted DNA-binding helix-hairpin-helix protein
MVEKQLSLLDVNAASIKELTALNGIGEKLAQEIINHRPYQALKDLINVPGISETKLSAIQPFLTLGKSKKKPSALQPSEKAPLKQTETEAFIFLEDRNERQDALLIILGGFILGLIILFMRRSRE